MKKYRDRESKNKYWDRVNDEWSKSGLSQAAYCSRSGISIHTFKSKRQGILSRLSEKQVKPNLGDFIPITVKKTSPIKSVRSIKLLLDKGGLLFIPEGFNERTLSRILEVVNR